MIINDLINEFCISYSAFVPWTRAEGELLSKSKASWPFLAFGFWLLFCEGSCCILLGSALCGAQGCTERYKRERERNMWNMWMQFWRTHGNVWKCRLGLVCCVLRILKSRSKCHSCRLQVQVFLTVESVLAKVPVLRDAPFSQVRFGRCHCRVGSSKDGVCFECSFAACLALYYCTGCRHVASDEFPSSNFLIAMTSYVESCLRVLTSLMNFEM